MLWVSPDFSTMSDGSRMKNLSRQLVSSSLTWALILPQSCLLFCSCILFAIALGQLVTLKFLVQQVELKWLILKKWRRLFHSSRVKFPLVNMSVSWCWCQKNGFEYVVQINPVNQPVQINSVGPWNMSHGGTATFDYHGNHGSNCPQRHTT